MKRMLLFVMCGFLAFGCKKGENQAVSDVNLADGTHKWFVNADEIGSSVAGFENTNGLLKFSFNRAIEVAEEEKWTWAEIMVTKENSDWNGFTGIEITYNSDKNLRVILCDSELEESDAAAGFFVTLPISANDTTITFDANNKEHFVQHGWVYEEFPNIRKTIDNTKLYGIKIGTNAMGETTNSSIKKFILKGVK